MLQIEEALTMMTPSARLQLQRGQIPRLVRLPAPAIRAAIASVQAKAQADKGTGRYSKPPRDP